MYFIFIYLLRFREALGRWARPCGRPTPLAAPRAVHANATLDRLRCHPRRTLTQRARPGSIQASRGRPLENFRCVDLASRRLRLGDGPLAQVLHGNCVCH